ncbi:unnamed protein product [Adineta steineri]|uniref:N-acetyltransferase domain-containing protein n=1 Tax=Adineta steineri TaxID=433720 RepID=A0A814LDN6_9BILA|nr:unnamed protein product [Adineta steineri]CAF1063281.1 unnamed protein product [Adineta steineri]
MNNQFVFRRADISDIDKLSILCQKTYHESVVEDLSVCYPEKDLNYYLHSAASPEWFTNTISDPKRAVCVVEDQTNGEFVAYAVAGSSCIDAIPHPDICSDKDGALYRLYVRRDRQSYGFGKQLMNVVLSWLEEHYHGQPVWLTVFSENLKAQKFYTHYGFNKVGEWDFPIGEWKDHDFIMKREANTS